MTKNTNRTQLLRKIRKRLIAMGLATAVPACGPGVTPSDGPVGNRADPLGSGSDAGATGGEASAPPVVMVPSTCGPTKNLDFWASMVALSDAVRSDPSLGQAVLENPGKTLRWLGIDDVEIPAIGDIDVNNVSSELENLAYALERSPALLARFESDPQGVMAEFDVPLPPEIAVPIAAGAREMLSDRLERMDLLTRQAVLASLLELADPVLQGKIRTEVDGLICGWPVVRAFPDIKVIVPGNLRGSIFPSIHPSVLSSVQQFGAVIPNISIIADCGMMGFPGIYEFISAQVVLPGDYYGNVYQHFEALGMNLDRQKAALKRAFHDPESEIESFEDGDGITKVIRYATKSFVIEAQAHQGPGTLTFDSITVIAEY